MVESRLAPLVLGIDLGGTKILAGVVDRNHGILGRAKFPTPAKAGSEGLRHALVSAGKAALANAGVEASDLSCVGIGSPGPLDLETGTIRYSPNLDVRDFPLQEVLHDAFGHPVAVQNDVRAGGYGEYRLGAARGHASVIAAFVGTGVGGCLIMDGRIVEGATKNAGEIGHLVVKAGGPKCGCGQRGCLEALASRSAIVRRVHKAIRNGRSTVLEEIVTSKRSRLKSKALAAAFEAKDAVAVREVERSARYLGLALGGLINTIGPEMIVIGGGVAEAIGAPYLELTRDAARKQAMADPDRRVRIELSELMDDSGLLGATLIARERFAPSSPSAAS